MRVTSILCDAYFFQDVKSRCHSCKLEGRAQLRENSACYQGDKAELEAESHVRMTDQVYAVKVQYIITDECALNGSPR